MMNSKALAVGQIVHYVSRVVTAGPEHLPAMILRVVNREASICNLIVFIDGDGLPASPELSIR